MSSVIKAVYEDGVFKPKEPVDLREHTEVEVRVAAPDRVAEGDPTGWEAARELTGCIEEPLVAADVSLEPDRHVYRRDP